MAAEAELRCQELVIGSGPGGSITACLLAERGRDVVILEEGPELALESCEPFGIEEMLQKYRSGGLNVAFGNPKIAYVEGRVTGGGSEINSGLYHRTPEAVIERWRSHYRLDSAAPGDLDGHYTAVERALNVGPMPGRAPQASLMLAGGAEALGWAAQEVPRWFRYDGTFDAEGVARGTRQSMSKTYLRRAREAGARLHAGTRALTLVRSGGGWIADCRRGSGRVRVRAGHVFVCAGAVHTPFLLRRSGVTRHVGDSLAMHPTVKVLARFPGEVNSGAADVPVHQVKEFAPRMGFGCSISTLPYLMLGLVDYPAHRTRLREQWRHLANYYTKVTGPATGRVRGAPIGGDPVVRYQVGSEDLRDLSLALQRLCRMLFAAGAVELFPSLSGIEPLTSPDQISRIPCPLPADRTSLINLHVFSSCPMGENAALAACDSFGRVHGASGLSVHDTSLLCTAPGVNPQGTVMAFAHRNTSRYVDSL